MAAIQVGTPCCGEEEKEDQETSWAKPLGYRDLLYLYVGRHVRRDRNLVDQTINNATGRGEGEAGLRCLADEMRSWRSLQ